MCVFTAKYLDVIAYCRRLIASAGKKSYLLSVGKPNVAKLGNFPELDMFVFVSCKLASLELDVLAQRGGSRDIVTPFELGLALDPYDESLYIM